MKNKQRIAQSKEILLSPDLSPEKLEDTLSELLKTTSPEAMQLLAEAIAAPYNQQVQAAAYVRLQAFNYDRPVPIAAVCGVWQRNRNPKLKTLLQQKNWLANAPLELKLLTHLLINHLDNLDDGSLDFVAALVPILRDPEPEIAANARILAGQIKEPNRQALLLFLSGQWEQYESLDFDQRLMRLNYQAATETLRRTIMDIARSAGRTDFARIVTNSRSSQDVSKMSATELDLLLDLLTQNERWDELWHLVHNSSVNHSLRIIHRLAKTSWQPSSPYQQTHFNLLKQLAVQLKEGFIPVNKLIKPSRELYFEEHIHDFSTRDCPYITYNSEQYIRKFHGSIKFYDFSNNETSTLTIDNLRFFSVSSIESIIVYTLYTHYTPPQKYMNFYNYEKKQLLWSTDLPFVEHEPHFLFSPNKKLLILASTNGITVFSCSDGNMLIHLPRRNIGGHILVHSVAVSSDSKFFATGNSNGTVTIYRTSDWQIINEVKVTPTTQYVTSLSFSSDNYNLVCSTLQSHTIELLNIVAPKVTKHLNNLNKVSVVGFSPNGQLLIAASNLDQAESLLNFWSTSDWYFLSNKIPFNVSNHLAKLIFSPDERKLIIDGGKSSLLCDTQWLRLWEFPLEQLTTQDLEYIFQQLPDQSLTASERTWLLFTKAILEWRLQHEIELQDVADNIPTAEWDIELDG